MQQENKSPNGHFCDRMDNRMRDLGMNGVELAAKAGITPTAVSRYRQGRIPAAEELLRISQVLKTSMEYLLTGQGPSPAPPLESGSLRELKAETHKLLRQLEAVEETAKRLRSFLG